MKMNAADWVAWVLVLVGGLNWGLVGFFQYDLVASIFGGSDNVVARVVYALVGLAALYIIVMMAMKGSKKEAKDASTSM